MSSQYGPLTPEIGSGIWVILANFNGFRVLASILQWRRSPEANQTLHDVWPSPGLVHDIYIFSGALGPWLNFVWCNIHFTSKSCVFLYWQRYCTALQQRHGTRNGITELSQRAPPIFGSAAITLGIGPHCSLNCFHLVQRPTGNSMRIFHVPNRNRTAWKRFCWHYAEHLAY